MNTLSLYTIHEYNENHKIIKGTIADFLSIKEKIYNWEYNRPPDISRVTEIAKWIYRKNAPLDWMFYMIYDNEKQKYNIIDGIHRWEAIKMIERENKKERDFVTPGVFGYNGNADWFYELPIIISIRYNQSIGEVVDLFQSINKSNPIPELYLSDRDNDKRKCIEILTDKWQKQYGSHFSPNRKTNIPNINRDRFMDLLSFVYDKYSLDISTSGILEIKVEEANQYLRDNIPKRTTIKMREKCMKTGCFLFLVSIDDLQIVI